MSNLFGSDSSKEAMQAQQRRTLADLARQQAEVDQAGASGGKKSGRGLLTFLNGGSTRSPDMLSGGGNSKFGSA